MVETLVFRTNFFRKWASIVELSCLAEIGDYVEQDEEIATIETDKV